MSNAARVGIPGAGDNGTIWLYNSGTDAWELINLDTRVRTSRLDQMAAPTASVGLNSQRIVSLANPSGAQDAATKAYVDSVAQGLDPKQSAKAATTANITLSGAQTIDGVSVVASDRVLVKNQTTGSQNGIYVAASGAWTRSTDADVDAEVTSGMYVFVDQGTVNADSGWVLSTPDPITLNTTSLLFVQFTGAAQIVAGAALLRTGNTLDVGVDDTTIEVNADALRVKSGGITPGMVSGFDTQVRTSRLDQMAAPTSSVSLNSQKITGLATPTIGTDAATKAYADSISVAPNLDNFDFKQSVRAASTANLTLSGAQTIDGVSVIAGDRVLAKNQTTGSQNGLYVAASGAWTRATDADAASEMNAGMVVVVTEGTVNGDTGWLLTTNDPVTVGTTSLTFALALNGNKTRIDYGNSGTSLTIDVSLARTIRVTVNADWVIAWTGWPASGSVGQVELWLTKDNSGTARALTWPSSARFPFGPAAPPWANTTANALTKFLLTSDDGGGTVMVDKMGQEYA